MMPKGIFALGAHALTVAIFNPERRSLITSPSHHEAGSGLIVCDQS
jgi:hypothetical protein